jgi:hypothetical protein
MPSTHGAFIRVRPAGFKPSLKRGAFVAHKKKTARVVKKIQYREAYQRAFPHVTEELS